jgi:membrane-associated phospholipid phosphatase
MNSAGPRRHARRGRSSNVLRRWTVCVICATASGVALRPADAQPASILSSDTAFAAPAAAPAVDREIAAPTRFVHDVASDYRHFFSGTNAAWLAAGGLVSLAVHQADATVQETSQQPDAPRLPGGSVYGSQILQVPVAIAWWALGHAAGSERGAAAGRDLLRAQISVASWTYAIKFAVNRTRPNGEPYSFPSGHASTSFATAMTLQEHYGWKLGVPAFVAAGYTAASRLPENQHWLSDVTFGAVLGIVCGRTVTVHLRETQLTIVPLPTAGGARLVFNILRPLR